jgi:hypothetical protein
MEFKQNHETFEVTLTQRKKIEGLREIVLETTRKSCDKTEVLNENEKSQLRALGGRILYIACSTRPDIASNSSMLSGIPDATLDNITQINKVVRYLKNSSTLGLTFKSIQNPELICYGDAALNNLGRGGSQGGYTILLVDKNDMKHEVKTTSIIAWKSARIKRVVTNTLSAEILQQTAS